MKLVWSKEARNDLVVIRAYIARDSELHAAILVAKLINAAEGLKQFPEMGRKAMISRRGVVREILCDNYRIFYRLKPELIDILGVIHTARELERIVKKRLEIH
jgi:toxin ParE1/3/4